jgi:hypothetical protein
MFVNIIVAYSNNKGIGKDNSLPWKIPSDLKKFKKLTTGNKKNAIIMGKNTYLSLNKRSLPNRDNLTDLYLFIKNKYLANKLLESISELQSKYQNAKDFITSDLFNTIFIDDFSDLDIKYIQEFDISIYFIDENIYYDDTLEIIKFKFLKYYNQSISSSSQVSYEEIYMYGLINKQYNPSELYNTLSDNNTNKISNENLKQYLLNVNEQIQIYQNILQFNQGVEPDISILIQLILYN